MGSPPNWHALVLTSVYNAPPQSLRSEGFPTLQQTPACFGPVDTPTPHHLILVRGRQSRRGRGGEGGVKGGERGRGRGRGRGREREKEREGE
jgi:hypothetical protein